MDREILLRHVRESLAAIRNPRFFETERDFQGALLAQLEQRIPKSVWPEGTIIEQEYQKRLKQHGLSIRPDIIIHEPFDPEHHMDRTEGNYAVFELKLNATETEATEDFDSLRLMIEALHYPLAIFVNISSQVTWADCLTTPRRKSAASCSPCSTARNGRSPPSFAPTASTSASTMARRPVKPCRTRIST